jgi:hypothetical protein
MTFPVSVLRNNVKKKKKIGFSKRKSHGVSTKPSIGIKYPTSSFMKAVGPLQLVAMTGVPQDMASM